MRRLTVFWKTAIFWAVIGFTENFTVKALKADYDGSTRKQGQNKDSETCKKFVQIGIFKFVMGFIAF